MLTLGRENGPGWIRTPPTGIIKTFDFTKWWRKIRRTDCAEHPSNPQRPRFGTCCRTLAKPAGVYKSRYKSTGERWLRGYQPMSRASRKEMFRAMAEEFNEEKRYEFDSLGNSGQYNDEQKNYAFELINESGVRATSRILEIPRRTLQRWCRRHRVIVRRCPFWVYEWAERRRKKREFWQRKGYS